MVRTLLVAVFATASLISAQAGSVNDTQFVETTYVSKLSAPTGLSWAPDGSKLIVTQKDGIVQVIKNGAILPTPFATIAVFTNSECGVIGSCFDLDYATNKYVYFFVTVSNTEQQIVRFTDTNDVGTAKTLILGGLPTKGNNHDGGGIAMGTDRNIYFSIGDNGDGTGVNNDFTTLAAKVGRCDRDGGVPADNPFIDGAGPNNDYIYARGFRNPFTMTFQPTTGKLWVDCVGDAHEQIFQVEKGDHAGWNNLENNQTTGFITPRIVYRTNGHDTLTVAAAPNGAVRAANVITITTTAAHGFRKGEKISLAGIADTSFNADVFVTSTPSTTTFTAAQTGTNSTSGGGQALTQTIGGCVTGGTFYQTLANNTVTGTNFSFPQTFNGNYFFGDLNSGRIMRATLDATDNSIVTVDEFVTGVTSIVDIAEGPDGALYYVSNGSGTLFRLAPKDQVSPPPPTPIGPADDDGDGVSNDNEIAAGTNPLDATSFTPTAFTITRLTASVKFDKTGKDRCSITGVFPTLPAGLVAENKPVQIIVGGVNVPFVLTKKASEKKDDKASISLRMKPSKHNKATKADDFLGGNVTFKATLAGSFASPWTDEGVAANVKVKTPLTFRVDATFNGIRYRMDVPVDFKSSAKSGAFREPKQPAM